MNFHLQYQKCSFGPEVRYVRDVCSRFVSRGSFPAYFKVSYSTGVRLQVESKSFDEVFTVVTFILPILT